MGGVVYNLEHTLPVRRRNGTSVGIDTSRRRDQDRFYPYFLSGERRSDKTTFDGYSKSVLELSSPEGEELGSCLPTDDMDRKVSSVDHRPTIVCPPFRVRR